MININEEHILTLSQVPAYLQSRGFSRRMHVASVYRWASLGADGLVLETVRIGGLRVTSAEAIQRWVEARQRTVVESQPAQERRRPFRRRFTGGAKR